MKTNLEKMDLTMYYEKLDNGLDVYIVPFDKVNSVYVTFSTKFGSIHDEFIPYDRSSMTKFPLGIAHFLEHKLFEQKNGVDPFTFYSERGSDANANTSNFKTTYLFSGTNFFDENLNYLLDYVQEPYFTDENVEKEKGIIEQEIRMYEDSPYYKLYDRILYNTFKNHPIKYPIAGTISSIKKITKKDLYTCYYTFYHPSNMFLVITGNVDVKDALSIIRSNQENKVFKPYKEIKLKEYDEPDSVCTKIGSCEMAIEVPKVSIGYKIRNNTKLSINKFKAYIGMFFDIKFGSVSLFNETIKKDNLATLDMDITLVNTDKHVLVILSNDTNNSKELINRIESELEDRTILETDFNRKKKVKKSSVIYKSDSIYTINNKIMANIINEGSVITDEHAYIDLLNYEEMVNTINNIDLNNKTIYNINKKKD